MMARGSIITAATAMMPPWWLKAYLFSREADLTGSVLYFDGPRHDRLRRGNSESRTPPRRLFISATRRSGRRP